MISFHSSQVESNDCYAIFLIIKEFQNQVKLLKSEVFKDLDNMLMIIISGFMPITWLFHLSLKHHSCHVSKIPRLIIMFLLFLGYFAMIWNFHPGIFCLYLVYLVYWGPMSFSIFFENHVTNSKDQITNLQNEKFCSIMDESYRFKLVHCNPGFSSLNTETEGKIFGEMKE